MFLIIPIDVAANTDIKNISKLVYGYLFGYNQMFQSFPTAKQIADDLKKSIKTISESIAELKSCNLIKSIRTGKASIYEFLPIEDGNKVVRSEDIDSKIKKPDILEKNEEIVEKEDRNEEVRSEKLTNINQEEIHEFLPQAMKQLNRHRINDIPEELLNQFLKSMKTEREMLREFEKAIKISVQVKPEKRAIVFAAHSRITIKTHS